MQIHLQPLHQSIGIHKHLFLPVIFRVPVVDDAVVVGTDDHDVGGVVVEALGEIIDVVGVDEPGAVLCADPFAADLAAIVIHPFEALPDGPGQPAHLVRRVGYGDAGTGVLPHQLQFVLHLISFCDVLPFAEVFRIGDAVKGEAALPGGGIHRQILPFVLRDGDQLSGYYLPGGKLPVLLSLGLPQIIPGGYKDPAQRLRQLPALGIPDLQKIGVGGIAGFPDAQVPEGCLIIPALHIDRDLHALSPA